jgi:NAD(P)-dependent dehydrogenase (short-subunit alcohol dehydrogenase family)
MKTWFITGASRGFGARIAQLALERGDNVVATARSAGSVTVKLREVPGLLKDNTAWQDHCDAQRPLEQAVKRLAKLMKRAA